MAGGGVGDNEAMWRALLVADYFTIPTDQCPTCRNGDGECGKFFCVQCKVGGVCEATFEAGGEHAQHPRIRVWRVTRAFAVCVDDVRRFMTDALVDQIQLYELNSRRNCKFVRAPPKNAKDVKARVNEDARNSKPSRLRMCQGCRRRISHSKIPNHSDSPVCSLKCLLDHAQAQRDNEDEEEQRRRSASGERLKRRKQNKGSIVRYLFN